MTVKKTVKPTEVAKKEYWIITDEYNDSFYIEDNEKAALVVVNDLVADGVDADYLAVYTSTVKKEVKSREVVLVDA